MLVSENFKNRPLLGNSFFLSFYFLQTTFPKKKKTLCSIPYLGVYLTDLVFLGDSTPDILENGLINCPKMNKMADVIKRILDHKCSFNFTVIEKAQEMLKSLHYMEDKDAYSISKQIE